MAIWCAQLALDRWRHSQNCKRGKGPDAQALVLTSENAHGPRITATNDAAQEGGITSGMMLADARALCPQLQSAPSDAGGDLAFLERFALWSQRWGPWSALDPPNGVLVDVSALAHLFGGERALLHDVEQRCSARGLHVRIAIAPSAGAAWALAHYGPHLAILEPDEQKNSNALGINETMPTVLAGLPIGALRLDQDVMVILHRLGLKRLSDLLGIERGSEHEGQNQASGRDAIKRRFRSRHSPAANPLLRLDQLLGIVPEPLLPIIAEHPPMVQRRLMEPIRHRDLLAHVLADLADDMVRELEGRGQGARRLELDMWRVDGEVISRRLELAALTRDGAHICRLFASRLDDIDAGFGIEMLRLTASWAGAMAIDQQDLEAAAQDHGTSLAACIDRLSVRLGADAVRRPILHGSHIPERAQKWQSPLQAEPAVQGEFAFHARPIKLLDPAEKIAVLYASPDGQPRRFRWRGSVHEVARTEGPERISPEWWREKGFVRLRDYYRIEDEAGRRYWIYRAGLADDGRGGMPDWFLQGLFA